MYPELQLDNENFDEIVSEAKHLIAGIYPAWSDYNLHDPGITMIELFAWLKEIQQYHLDQIRKPHLMKYLKLLGMNLHPARPAQVVLEVHSDHECFLPKYTRFYGNDICFETTKNEYLITGKLIRIITVSDSQVHVEEEQLNHPGKMRVYPFGNQAKEKSVCYLQLSEPLPINQPITLTCYIEQNRECCRNEIDNEFLYPLADISFDYYSEAGWQPLENFTDTTHQFLQNGQLTFNLNYAMQKKLIIGHDAYVIRMSLNTSNYETAPIFKELSFAALSLTQKQTLVASDIYGSKTLQTPACTYQHYAFLEDGLCEIDESEIHLHKHVLTVTCDHSFKNEIAIGNGFANQSYELGVKDLLKEDLEVFVERYDKPGIFIPWTRVDDFVNSKKEDQHYVYDEEQNRLCFGDGFNGLQPEGRIRIFNCSCSLKGKGNIKAGCIDACDVKGLHVVQNKDAFNGRDCERVQECFDRFFFERAKLRRAVTLSDYETIVKRTPGLMIQSCKAVESDEDNTIHLIVRPYGHAQALNTAYRQNILAYLEDKRLLGTRLCLHSPEYIKVSVYVELYISAHYRDAVKLIEKAIADFFEQESQYFGKALEYGRLYDAINQIACVDEIRSLNLETYGNKIRRNQNNDILPPINGVFLLEGCICNTRQR